MRGKAIVVVLCVTLFALVLAAPAMAGQQTAIINAANSVDLYTYTPTTTGTFAVTISFTRADGTGTPAYPEAEVDGCVQTYDGTEDYFDVDVAGLYSGTNPCTGSYSVKASGVNKPIYLTVLGYVGQVPYRVVATFNGTTVIDSGAIDVTNPAQKWAYGVDSDLYLPNTGTLLSGFQTWPGSLNRGTGVSDVYANWDDYVYSRTESPLVENYSVEYTNSPAVWDVTSINAAKTGKWYIPSPMKWTAAVRPNVWTNIATDQYPRPGNSSATTAKCWYTISWPDAALADAPTYFWGATSFLAASRASFSGSGDKKCQYSFKFNGDSLKWWYTKFNKGGIAKMTIDSVDKGNVDLYNATLQTKQSTTYSGLGAGNHTAVVTNTGTKNASSTGYWITHDAFEAKSDTTDVTPFSENNMDPYTQYKWGVTSSASASGGTWTASGDKGGGLAFSFQGTSITWKYTKFNKCGIARVYIDGVDKGTVDQYSSTLSYQQTTTFSGLPNAWHTILIVSDQTKNASATGYWTTHDAFTVGATTYEN